MGEHHSGMKAFRCGYVSILGRPNVGKSTLLNRLIQQKISITSRKPQTTRNKILGIRTQAGYQAIYMDTPGLQKTYDSPVHRYMNAEARNSLADVDVVVFMIVALKWTEEDEMVLKLLQENPLPFIVAINKVDKLKDKKDLLPFIKSLTDIMPGVEFIPISARKGSNLEELEKVVYGLLPEGEPLYSDDAITDKNKRFFAAEFIREKLINRLGDELPYRIAVSIEEFTEEETIIWLKAIIWVEGKSQKNIVIGKNGIILKAVGEAARLDLEKMFGKKIHLKTWVKIKKNWTLSENVSEQLGLDRD